MQPHPILADRYPTATAKPAYVDQLFDRGARHYDAIVDWGFLRSGSAYRRAALRRHHLHPPMLLLDVACGTGLVAIEAAKILGGADHITCLDPSSGMLAVARTKLSAHFVQGRAESLPLADQSFDYLTMGYALRHVTCIADTFREFHRVLKPGGRLLLLEVTKPEGWLPRLLFRSYFGRLYPFLTRLFTRSDEAGEMMRYYWETMDAAVPPAVILEALQDQGFTAVKCHKILGLFCEYTATKARPATQFRPPYL